MNDIPSHQGCFLLNPQVHHFMVLPGFKSSIVQGPYYNKGIGDGYSKCSTTHIATITLLYILYTERNWPGEKSPPSPPRSVG